MSIKLKLQGFEELLKAIEAAGGTIDNACTSAMKQSGQIMQSHLKSEMKSVGVKDSLINRMPAFTVDKDGNEITAHVGYTATSFNSKRPSDYHKAIFLNYGTPNRRKHGQIKARGFVAQAKKRANPQIKKQQKIALEKILERLKK